jgi:hypothetical protein
MRTNDPRSDTQYSSLELAVVKRSSRGYQFSGSYSATKFTGGLGPNTAFGPADNPNAEINAAADLWEWQAKVNGSYLFPWGITGAANYELRSGDPWARTVRITGGSTIPNFTMPVEERDANRLPKHSLLDARISKTVTIYRRQRLDLQVNIYNVLNANTIQGIQTRSGATFGQPIDSGGYTILPPRIMQVGFTYRF